MGGTIPVRVVPARIPQFSGSFVLIYVSTCRISHDHISLIIGRFLADIGKKSVCVCVHRQNLALIVLVIGALFSFFFHLGTNESWRSQATGEEQEEGPEEEEEDGEQKPLLRGTKRLPVLLQWKCWLRQQSFYQAGGAP